MDLRSPSTWRRWDLIAAVTLIVLAFVPGVERQGVDLAELPDHAMNPLGWVLLIAQGAAIALLRRKPALSLALVGTAFGAYQVLGYPTTFAALGLLIAVVGAGALVRRHRRAVAFVASVGYVLVCIALGWVGSPTRVLEHVVFGLLLTSLWLAGTWLRNRAHAQRLRGAEAERAAVAAERARIARELHDVVTHHVTAMVVQAEATQYSTDDIARTTKALAMIGETGRAALTDLRGLLGALDGTVADSSRTPAITDVDDLVARARAGGQPIEFAREGVPRTLDATRALAITRVVQEGLTNAIKHAGGAAAHVRLRYDESEVEVTVTTRTAVVPGWGDGGGHGLVGLRERIALVGGEFSAGPDDAGFVVHARIPA